MRILVAHESIDGLGGAETYLRAVIAALAGRSHRVAVLYHHSKTPGSDICAIPGAELTVGVDLVGMDAALSAVRAFQPAICFSHNMGALEVDERLLAEFPVAKMMHGYFGTCMSSLKTHAFPRHEPCGRVFGPACLALYGPRRCGSLDPVTAVRGYRWASRQRDLLPRYAGIVVASRHMGDEYLRHGVPPARVHVLPLFGMMNGEAPADPNVRARGESVLFMGRMTSLKGGHLLVRAVADAQHRIGRRVALVMAGDGPQRESWIALARSLDVTARFPGWLEPADAARAIDAAALIAVPSVWPEPFGLVGLEAGQRGVPAVAFDVGGIREWLSPGENGLLVPFSDGARGLGATIARLLTDDPLRTALGAGARTAAARLSLDAHVDRLEPLLQSLARA